MIRPYYDDGKGIVIYNADCRAVLAESARLAALRAEAWRMAAENKHQALLRHRR